jgi:hypothetical protein
VAPAGEAAAAGAAVAAEKTKPSADLHVKPPAEPAAAEAALKAEVPAKKGSVLLRWSPVATAALAVGLGAYAGMQANSAKSYYETANGYLVGGSLQPGIPVSKYNQYVSNGDDAHQKAVIAGVSAGVMVAATGVLSYFSYGQTKEIGPFRF